ncbi:MAG: S-adenosylmethionine:tRNA ribosyltransferase-isomerase [Bacteroidales bacterium]|nr:S-adenosylmethionine:tRNA ribosyltransferase-isomerase [Bacteroidales bacterium]
MPDYKNIKIKDFIYPLPEEYIAKYPASKRSDSKLLIWSNGVIKKDIFRNIDNYIPAKSLMIFNNTKVIHARILFKKKSGATIEIFCLEPLQPSDHQLAFSEKGKTVWKCLIGNSKKWKNEVLEKEIEINKKTITLQACKKAVADNSQAIEFSWGGDSPFAEIIETAGVLPIPPYLKRDTEPSDEENYQTVYAKLNGSVAAPTAGLHFTNSTLNKLKEKSVRLYEITLHVGAGTFKPVKTNTIGVHKMHTEKVSISKYVIEKLLYEKNKPIAVGTTTVRSVESLFWLGLKKETQLLNDQNLHISQWEPYEKTDIADTSKSLENILNCLEKTGSEVINFSTDIMIVPGYDFKLTKGMVTNFHLPASTLLLLVSAFLGNDWKKVYNFALTEKFRFLSYGDCNLYLKE